MDGCGDQRCDVGSKQPAALTVTRNFDPSSALAATAPRATTASGSTTRSSSSSQGRQALISIWLGLWWMRLPPLSVNLKCFTALVT